MNSICDTHTYNHILINLISFPTLGTGAPVLVYGMRFGIACIWLDYVWTQNSTRYLDRNAFIVYDCLPILAGAHSNIKCCMC